MGTAEPVSIGGFMHFTEYESDRHDGDLVRRLGISITSWDPPVPGLSERFIEVEILAREAQGVLEITRAALPDPREAGAVYNISARFTWQGGFLIDDFSHPNADPRTSSGVLEISGGDATLERRDSSDGDESLAGSAPYTLSGVFNVLDSATGALLSEQRIQAYGDGLVFLTSGSIEVFGLSYFMYSTPVLPIPEPATMALIGLGVAGLAARRRLTRHREGQTSADR